MHVDPSLRVAIIRQLSSLGGVQSCCLSLIKGLNRFGIIPDILWDVEPNWSLLNEAGVKANYRSIHFLFPSSIIDRSQGSFRYIARIANTIDGDKFVNDYDFFYIFYNGFLISKDVPHLRYLSGPPLLPQLVSISPGARGVPFKTCRWMYRSFLRKVKPVYEFHKGSNYVINSRFTASLFRETYGEELPIIYPPITLSGYSFHSHDLNHRNTLTFFSRFVDDKRPEMVVELAERHGTMQCVLMGGVTSSQLNYFKNLQTLARQRGVVNIVFMANPSNQRVKEVLAHTRFYIFPAINEHFGMTTAEAIASGAIPYVHNSGGQKEIVPDPGLRFSDSEFFEKFARLTRLPLEQLITTRKSLLVNIQKFSEEVYLEKMLSFLSRF